MCSASENTHWAVIELSESISDMSQSDGGRSRSSESTTVDKVKSSKSHSLRAKLKASNERCRIIEAKFANLQAETQEMHSAYRAMLNKDSSVGMDEDNGNSTEVNKKRRLNPDDNGAEVMADSPASPPPADRLTVFNCMHLLLPLEVHSQLT